MRTVLLVLAVPSLVFVLVFGTYLTVTPQYAAARFLHELRSGDADAALTWIDVPAVATSVVDVLQREWPAGKAGDPAQYGFAPLVRPLLQWTFGLARPRAQQRVAAEIRTMVRKVAAGDTDAVVQLPRWGGFPVAALGVLRYATFEGQPKPGEPVLVTVRRDGDVVVRVVVRRVNRRWMATEIDPAWLAGVLRERHTPTERRHERGEHDTGKDR